MKRIMRATLVMTAVLSFPVLRGIAEVAIDEATKNAVDKAAAELVAAPYREDIKTVAVLPFWGQRDINVTDLMKIAVTKGGKYRVFVREDREWTNLLSEMKWSELREDIMNPATIQRFGKISGVDAILYGSVREMSLGELQARVRLNVHLADVETGEHVWGTTAEGVARRPVADLWASYGKLITYFAIGVIALLIVASVIKRAIAAASRPR